MNYSLRIIPCERHQCCFFVVPTAFTLCPEQSAQIVIGDHVSTAYSQLLEARVNRFDIYRKGEYGCVTYVSASDAISTEWLQPSKLPASAVNVPSTLSSTAIMIIFY